MILLRKCGAGHYSPMSVSKMPWNNPLLLYGGQPPDQRVTCSGPFPCLYFGQYLDRSIDDVQWPAAPALKYLCSGATSGARSLCPDDGNACISTHYICDRQAHHAAEYSSGDAPDYCCLDNRRFSGRQGDFHVFLRSVSFIHVFETPIVGSTRVGLRLPTLGLSKV